MTKVEDAIISISESLKILVARGDAMVFWSKPQGLSDADFDRAVGHPCQHVWSQAHEPPRCVNCGVLKALVDELAADEMRVRGSYHE